MNNLSRDILTINSAVISDGGKNRPTTLTVGAGKVRTQILRIDRAPASVESRRRVPKEEKKVSHWREEAFEFGQSLTSWPLVYLKGPLCFPFEFTIPFF